MKNVVKVVLTYDDGSSATLSGEDVKVWEAWIIHCDNHMIKHGELVSQDLKWNRHEKSEKA